MNEQEEMDTFLELALLELLSSDEFPRENLSLSEFYETFILTKDGMSLNCKQSSYGSTLKWAKAMHKKGLLVVKVDKRSHVVRVTLLSKKKANPTTSSPDIKRLTAVALVSASMKEDNRSYNSGQNSLCDLEADDRSEISLAMSTATTTRSEATSAYTFQPTIHAKFRQKSRDISSTEIKSTLKHGAPIARYADGKKRS